MFSKGMRSMDRFLWKSGMRRYASRSHVWLSLIIHCYRSITIEVQVLIFASNKVRDIWWRLGETPIRTLGRSFEGQRE